MLEKRKSDGAVDSCAQYVLYHSERAHKLCHWNGTCPFWGMLQFVSETTFRDHLWLVLMYLSLLDVHMKLYGYYSQRAGLHPTVLWTLPQPQEALMALGEGQAQGWGVCGNLYLCNVHLTMVYLCRTTSLQHTHHCSMRMPLSDVLD